MESYTFLLGSLLTLALYAVIYGLRKDLRPQMKKFGFFIGLWSVGSSYFIWTADWWRPTTITGTRVGVEDFIFGFAIGGILVAGYEFFSRKKLVETGKYSNGLENTRKAIYLFLAVFLLAYTIAGIPSWLAWSSASVTATAVIVYYRRDLIKTSIGTGFISLGFALVLYPVLLWFNPGFVQQTYLLDQLSGILILGVPVEEFIWFFTSGCMVGPYYELYNEVEVVDL